ncbi:MAG: pyruvate kinase, partial [Candidatus Aenigmarchaeota archaeon]|nr:pyruvate kinase [Candidatus Aenigmarchaeota archaeon]
MSNPVKIIATIGPASNKRDIIEKLINNGVDVFRFNFKHNESEWHAETIGLVREVAKQIGSNVAILLDLPGPRVRLDLGKEKIDVKKDQLFSVEGELADGNFIRISHPEVINKLQSGHKVMADDGAFDFRVEVIKGKKFLRSESSGVLKNNKSVNFVDVDIDLPIIEERDIEGLRLAGAVGIDFIALSSVKDENDIKYLRGEMKKAGMDADIISKIETRGAIDNIDKIIEFSDGIMVARGDLGVEIPIEQVPYYQKIVVRKCIERGVPVIIATQMLHSMVDNSYPTRAEVSDVANAAYELADAVMLSAETAFGNYPAEAVSMMRNISEFNSRKFDVDTRKKFNFKLDNQASALCDAAYNLYLQSRQKDDKIEGFVVLTQSGKTAKLLSRYRPAAP